MIILDIHYKNKTSEEIVCEDIAVSGAHLFFTRKGSKTNFEIVLLEDCLNIFIFEDDTGRGC